MNKNMALGACSPRIMSAADERQCRQRPQTYYINSHGLKKTIEVNEIVGMEIDDLRALNYEVRANLRSMANAFEVLSKRLENEDYDQRETKEELASKLKQVSKKMLVYSTFQELIADEVKWQVESGGSSQSQTATHSGKIGLTGRPINALLEPSHCSDELAKKKDNLCPETTGSAIANGDRLQSLCDDIFLREYVNLLSQEFYPDELDQIRSEAEAAAEKLLDRDQLECAANKK